MGCLCCAALWETGMVRGGLSPLLPRDSPCLISAGYWGVCFCILLQLAVRLYTAYCCSWLWDCTLHIVAAGCETVYCILLQLAVRLYTAYCCSWLWDCTLMWGTLHNITLSLNITFTATSALEQSLKNLWTLWPAAVTYICMGHTVALLFEALRYRPEGREFDSRWYHASIILRAALWPWSGLSL